MLVDAFFRAKSIEKHLKGKNNHIKQKRRR